MQEAGLPGAARVSAVFEEVLEAPEFQYADASPLARLMATLGEALTNFLSRWWPSLGETQVRVMSWIALVVASVLLAMLVARWASRGHRSPSGGRREPAARPLDAHGWAAEARAAAAAGRYRQAATGVYQATILHLDSVGSLRYGAWKTPGDYALEASAKDEGGGRLADFLASFVEMAFGPREPVASDFDALSLRAAKLGARI
jgi:hypothetical protein